MPYAYCAVDSCLEQAKFSNVFHLSYPEKLKTPTICSVGINTLIQLIDIKIIDKLIDGNVLSGSISLLMLYLSVISLMIFILIDIATMNYCSRFLKNGPNNMCCQIHWWILSKEFRRILMSAIFLCHWQFLRQNTDDIFCGGASKQFIALCNFLLKRLIIYRQKFHRY